MENRVGRIDLGAQAEVASARRTDTPPAAVVAPEGLSPSARERARDNEKGRGMALTEAERQSVGGSRLRHSPLAGLQQPRA